MFSCTASCGIPRETHIIEREASHLEATTTRRERHDKAIPTSAQMTDGLLRLLWSDVVQMVRCKLRINFLRALVSLSAIAAAVTIARIRILR
mmetsp:Transcript_67475/g.133797  ORF Transcript_67475/g.133797 Transcript_67475/m.133797 type:complete len:92 (+) Transcript_67475:181-456(+)